MDDRYKRAAELGLTEAPHTQLYIIIDELADLMTTNKKQIEPMLARLAQLGRAARMHIIAATQNPSRKIITAPIKVNMPSSVALRCRDKIESKMLIGDDSALSLPMYGYGVYLTPSMPEPLQIPIPLVRPDYIKQQIDWWRQEERRYNKLINRIRRLFYIR
jgi:S-DNA-T family DNA segregation ATPase FtsK/SpoIIIE